MTIHITVRLPRIIYSGDNSGLMAHIFIFPVRGSSLTQYDPSPVQSHQQVWEDL